ncbi:MAG: ATP-binding protein [Bacteroidetes bacterium]|nr:ATP-binding protein [Bacteroidota bacterium]
MSLKVSIFSFGYNKSGLPADQSGNGGGFIFDCRFMHNPGRLEEFKFKTGKEEDVIQFIENQTLMPQFLESVFKIIDMAVDNYIERNFSSLLIGFGCTGGQHRSVYASESLAKHIHKKYPTVSLEITHRELGLVENF